MNCCKSLLMAGAFALAGLTNLAAVDGWLGFRGPHQNGTSDEKGLPDTIEAEKPLWKKPLPGQSTPVIANGKLYIMGYLGDGADLQEGVVCYDAETGEELWRRLYNDFLSDTIYLRYATSSPEIGRASCRGRGSVLVIAVPD